MRPNSCGQQPLARTSGLGRVAGAVRKLASAHFGSQLRRNTLAGSASSIVGALMSAASYPIYLHFLGYEHYGVWLAVSVVLSFATFGHLGLAPAVGSTVAERHANHDLAGIRETVSTALVTLTLIGVIALTGVLLLGTTFVGSLHLRPQLAAEASALLPFVAVLSLYTVQIDTINSVLIGLGRLDLAVGIQQTGRFLSLFVATVLLWRGQGMASLPLGSLTGNIFVHLASLSLAKRIAGGSCFHATAFSVKHLRKLLGFSLGVLASSVINFLLGPLNKLVITRFLGPAAVPMYDMAFTITMQMRGALDSGFTALMPEISRLRVLRSDAAARRIRDIYQRALKVAMAGGGVIFGVAALAAPIVLRIWLGTRFKPELVTGLQILLIGGFLSLSGVPGYHALLGCRRVSHVVAANALQAGTNAVLLALLCINGRLTPNTAAAAASTGISLGGLYLLVAGWMATTTTERNENGVEALSVERA